MSKCYYCSGTDKFCVECKRKVAAPSPNEAKAPIVTAEKIKPKVAKLYGFISRECIADGSGTAYYFRPDGSLVEVCWVCEDIFGGQHGWTDHRCVGEVTKYAQKGTPGRYEIPATYKR